MADRVDGTATLLDCDILSCIYNKYTFCIDYAQYKSASKSLVARRITDINLNTLGGTLSIAVVPPILFPIVEGDARI